MPTAILIDDEYYALEGLKMELEELGVKVVGMFEDGVTAMAEITRLKPQVAFVDIDMPEMSGLELFNRLLEASPKTHIVFVTAYDQYAVEAFELNAMDYIVKPVVKERLIKTLDRLNKKAKPVNKKISINCFGHLSIKVDGEEADISWRTKKVEEMVAYLACGEGKYISKNKIAQVLWPNLDMEKSKGNFYLAYHYLKKQSDQSRIEIPLESARGKLRLKVEEVDLDIIQFKKGISELKEIKENNRDKAEKVLGLYRGMLLEEHCYDWSTEWGQHYDILYNELLRKIVKYFEEKKNIKKQKYYLEKLNM